MALVTGEKVNCSQQRKRSSNERGCVILATGTGSGKEMRNFNNAETRMYARQLQVDPASIPCEAASCRPGIQFRHSRRKTSLKGVSNP